MCREGKEQKLSYADRCLYISRAAVDKSEIEVDLASTRTIKFESVEGKLPSDLGTKGVLYQRMGHT